MKSKIILSSLCALLLALPACGDTKKTETKVTKTETKTVTTKTETSKTDDTAKKTDPVAKVDDNAKPEDPPKADPNAEKVQLAATVAREISQSPDNADEILARFQLDRDKLDALMFEIASDPELTSQYMAARKAAT